MEPLAPSCSGFGYSQMWLEKPTLNVITTTRFGGFGWLHDDVYVEIDATVAPGFASLGVYGNCYEQHAGILRTQDMRIDKGGHLQFSIGDNASGYTETYRCKNGTVYNLGEYADFLDVDSLTLRGNTFVDIVVRAAGLSLGESACFPIIRYKTVGKDDLNNLKLTKYNLSSADHPSIDGNYRLAFDIDEECRIVSLCVVPEINPIIKRQIIIPSVAGVTSYPPAGIHFNDSHTDFDLKLVYATPTATPLAVNTNRYVDEGGVRHIEDELVGRRNLNGEYEYVIRDVREDIQLSIGPGFASDLASSNGSVDGPAIWSHNNLLYIKVDREDIASIYSIAGQLVKRVEIPEGNTSIPMERGVYVITLKDGAIHKIIIK
jgi:hypothetical protein